MSVEIYKTADQSNTLYVPELNETYHSRNGAFEESQYVFIGKGLQECALHKKEIRLLEIGFGTGLNALLTLSEAKREQLNVYYHSLETFPLPYSLVSELGYEQWSDGHYSQFLRMHESEWNTPVLLTSEFILLKEQIPLQNAVFTEPYDVVYFDAFAPEKQPELWTGSIFEKLFQAMNPGGILVTYSSKGEVKRNLRAAGFMVERLPGHPKKRHMLRARKP